MPVREQGSKEAKQEARGAKTGGQEEESKERGQGTGRPAGEGQEEAKEAAAHCTVGWASSLTGLHPRQV